MMIFAFEKTVRLKGKLVATGLAALSLFLAGCAGGDPLHASKSSDTRFIPLALWAGAHWDGRDRSLHPVVRTVTGGRANRTIAGPLKWTDPKTDRTLSVYERINKKASGTKRQLFVVNAGRTALGRVYDSRPGQADRYFTGDAIFPLGEWKRGEERTFKTVEHTDSGPVERTATIKIRRLDYTYKDVPDSLKYDWTLRDANGKVLFRENYIYSPGRGMVRFRNLLKERSSTG